MDIVNKIDEALNENVGEDAISAEFDKRLTEIKVVQKVPYKKIKSRDAIGVSVREASMGGYALLFSFFNPNRGGFYLQFDPYSPDGDIGSIKEAFGHAIDEAFAKYRAAFDRKRAEEEKLFQQHRKEKGGQ